MNQYPITAQVSTNIMLMLVRTYVRTLKRKNGRFDDFSVKERPRRAESNTSQKSGFLLLS